MIERRSPDAAIDLVEKLMARRLRKSFGLDPVEDVQILTPMQRGPTGAIALNEMLQRVLNGSDDHVRRGNKILKLDDKVMQLRNNYDKDIFNGDIGRVVGIDKAERKLTVRFDNRNVVYSEAELDELTLAYATSIHKSQGSEYKAVIVLLLTQHFVMLSRNLLYTAVTRGKQLVVLVTDPRALSLALAEVRKEDRKTYLAPRLAARQL